MAIEENGGIETFRLLDDEDDVLHIIIIVLMCILIAIVVIYFCYQNYFRFKLSELDIARLKTSNKTMTRATTDNVQTEKIAISTKLDNAKNVPPQLS